MAISRSLKDGGYKGAMGLFHEVDEQRTAENQRELLALKCHSVNQNITELSGGNQQKVLISKWLCCRPEVIIFDEPTRAAFDVGAESRNLQSDAPNVGGRRKRHPDGVNPNHLKLSPSATASPCSAKDD